MFRDEHLISQINYEDETNDISIGFHKNISKTLCELILDYCSYTKIINRKTNTKNFSLFAEGCFCKIFA